MEYIYTEITSYVTEATYLKKKKKTFRNIMLPKSKLINS